MGSAPAIAVTGLGVVSAWGWFVNDFRAGLLRAATAIGPFDGFDHSAHATHVAAQVPPVPRTLAATVAAWRRLSRAERFAVIAAREALAWARLPSDLSAVNAGVFFGSSTGGMLETEEFYEAWRCGRRRPSLGGVASQQVNRPGDSVARDLRVTGEVLTVSSACASGTLALGVALEALRDGRVEVALAGGADSLCRLTFGGFNALQCVDPEPCRPFRADRAGMSLGEGAAVLVLEPREQALARDVEPLAELRGAGTSADAYHMTAPEPAGRGAVRALEAALADAGLAPEEIDFVNAHGTGTELNDLAEFHALAAVFGERVRRLPLTSTKGSVGHLLGSAGAIEAAATVLALRDQEVQPTPGGGETDPRTPVRLLDSPHRAPLAAGASLNLGFGGCNGALVFTRNAP